MALEASFSYMTESTASAAQDLILASLPIRSVDKAFFQATVLEVRHAGDPRGDLRGLVAVRGIAEGERDVEVLYLVVDSRSREMGYGEALMKRVEELARASTSAQRVVLLVHCENATARAFYAKRGFRETGKVLKAYYPQFKHSDGIEMEKLLR